MARCDACTGVPTVLALLAVPTTDEKSPLCSRRAGEEGGAE